MTRDEFAEHIRPHLKDGRASDSSWPGTDWYYDQINCSKIPDGWEVIDSMCITRETPLALAGLIFEWNPLTEESYTTYGFGKGCNIPVTVLLKMGAVPVKRKQTGPVVVEIKGKNWLDMCMKTTDIRDKIDMSKPLKVSIEQ